MKKFNGQSRWSRLSLFVFCPLFFISSLFSQESIIKGRVTDKQNNPLANVQITLLDVSRGTKFTLKTKKDGSFFKVGIPPAAYKVNLTLEGYYPFDSQLRVDIGQEQVLNFTLEKIPPKIGDDPDFKEGMKYFEAGNLEAAINSFRKAVEKIPESIEANYNLAICYLRLEKVEEAINQLEKIIALRKDIPELYLALGEAYFKRGENEKAVTSFKQALELQPDNYRIFYDLGIIYYKNDQLTEAIASFDKAIALNPQFSSAYYQEGLAFIKQGDYPRAIEALEKFLQLEPEAREAPQVKVILEELKKKDHFLFYCIQLGG